MVKEFCLIFLVIGAVVAEVANFKRCEGYSDDVCEVTEVQITPCKDPKNCKLKKGKVSTINFDFIPKFSADKLTASLFWASDHGDVGFPGLEPDGCLHTSCPVEAGKKQQFNFGLRIGKKDPAAPYTIKWVVADTNDASKACCFKTNIEISK